MDAIAAPTKQETPKGLSYAQVRALLIIGGLALLSVVALVSYVRRVETVEVVAILLFIPIFLGVAFWDWRGGTITAVAAIGGYVAMRYNAIHAVGAGQFAGVILSRSVSFLAFGVIGGIANEQLRASLRKLDLYDQIDSDTGLFNARFFVNDTDLEMSRSRRYHTIFSICAVAVPVAALEKLDRRKRRRVTRELGRLLSASVRTVDRAVYGADLDAHRLAVVLPETGNEGGRVFGTRLAEKVSGFLVENDVNVGADGLALQTLTFPEDEDAINALRSQYAAIDAREHPETAATA